MRVKLENDSKWKVEVTNTTSGVKCNFLYKFHM